MLVVLTGVLGMHGLDNHGAAGMHTTPHAGMAESVAAVAATSHDAITEVAALAVDGPVVLASATVAPGGLAMDVGMATMCLAILAVALVALLRLLLTGTIRGVLWRIARPVRAPAYAGRDSDPPSLINLSIQRC